MAKPWMTKLMWVDAWFFSILTGLMSGYWGGVSVIILYAVLNHVWKYKKFYL